MEKIPVEKLLQEIKEKDVLLQSYQCVNAKNQDKIEELERVLVEKEIELANHRASARNQGKIEELERVLVEKEIELAKLSRSGEVRLKEKSDVRLAYELLRREGLKSFLSRLIWYMRGKRLVEDIEEAEFNK